MRYYFSWLARSSLPALVPGGRGKNNQDFLRRSPADVEKERQEMQDLTNARRRDESVLSNTMHANVGPKMIGASVRYNNSLIRLASRPELIKANRPCSVQFQEWVKMP